MRHATCNSRTTVEQQHAQSTCRKHRITHLPVAELAAPYRRLESICASSDPEGRADRKRRRETRQKNVRLTVQPRTHAPRNAGFSCAANRPPACPSVVRCSLSLALSHSVAPVPGRGQQGGTTQIQCHGSVATQHAREKKKQKGGNMKIKGRSGAGACVHHSCCFAHAPAPGRRVRAFFPPTAAPFSRLM